MKKWNITSFLLITTTEDRPRPEGTEGKKTKAAVTGSGKVFSPCRPLSPTPHHNHIRSDRVWQRIFIFSPLALISPLSTVPIMLRGTLGLFWPVSLLSWESWWGGETWVAANNRGLYCAIYFQESSWHRCHLVSCHSVRRNGHVRVHKNGIYKEDT